MPKETFFKLSEEKRRRILGAAGEEFTTVPYSEASINRIVKNAQIPRGSFYQYFEDKEDLFFYYMRQHGKFIMQTVSRGIDETGGDLFAALHGFADRLLRIAYHGEHPKVRIILSDPWVFQVMWNGIISPDQREWHRHTVQKYTSKVWDHVDMSRLNLADSEMPYFGCILGSVLRDSVQELFLDSEEKPEETAATEFHGKIYSLERHYSR
mgnify:FL=1